MQLKLTAACGSVLASPLPPLPPSASLSKCRMHVALLWHRPLLQTESTAGLLSCVGVAVGAAVGAGCGEVVTGPGDGDNVGSAAGDGKGEGSIVAGDEVGSEGVGSIDGDTAGSEVVGAGLGDADGTEIVGVRVGDGVGSVTVGTPDGAGVGLNDVRVGRAEGVGVGDAVTGDCVSPGVGGDDTRAIVGTRVAHASSWTIGPNLNCSGTVIEVELPWSVIVSVGARSIASFSILLAMSCGSPALK